MTLRRARLRAEVKRKLTCDDFVDLVDDVLVGLESLGLLSLLTEPAGPVAEAEQEVAARPASSTHSS